HMGVAPYRDFLLLGPAAEDATVDPRGFDDLVALSKKASGSTHPAVWSLPAPDDKPASMPALVRHEEESLWLLYTTVTVESDGGKTAEIPLALVVVGHAPEA
ncbi:MAG: hypothetical protein HY560_09505, partial [Gemmatimonadetes bacterium]|nr:hypothetical protein [Gemmatimonadota bacterium]